MAALRGMGYAASLFARTSSRSRATLPATE
jgi:hypothetical protein